MEWLYTASLVEATVVGATMLAASIWISLRQGDRPKSAQEFAWSLLTRIVRLGRPTIQIIGRSEASERTWEEYWQESTDIYFDISRARESFDVAVTLAVMVALRIGTHES